jgi:uncharacterized membrane protein YoaK (UPF0700 family)
VADKSVIITWTSLGLAFVGGYGDAASFILANTFTGHITGNFVLIAVSLAGRDWPTFWRRGLAIVLFLAGILLSVVLEQRLRSKPARFLPVVLITEIILVVAACGALSLQLQGRPELFILGMALALGLQNGAWRQAGGITVHSTYLTGMVTNLLTTGAKKYLSPDLRQATPDAGISLLLGIWAAFIGGAVLGAALVLRLGGAGMLGAAVVLLALLVGQILPRPPRSNQNNQ